MKKLCSLVSIVSGKKEYRLILCSACLILSLGCTSITSRLMTRDSTNTYWEETKLRGIPITLKVPTHLKVYVYDKHYLEFANNDSSVVQPVELDVPIRDFASEFMYTEKIFTVDFKRPAAGAFNLRLAMNNEQYFSQIQHDVTDQTIADVTTLLGDILKPAKGATLAGAPSGGVNPPNVSEVKSLVAVRIFELADPCFQAQVTEFLNCHLNKAHDAWVAAPGVVDVNRVRIPPGENLETPYPASPFCPDGNCQEPNRGPAIPDCPAPDYTDPGPVLLPIPSQTKSMNRSKVNATTQPSIQRVSASRYEK
jgi:hypothetical protein